MEGVQRKTTTAIHKNQDYCRFFQREITREIMRGEKRVLWGKGGTWEKRRGMFYVMVDKRRRLMEGKVVRKREEDSLSVTPEGESRPGKKKITDRYQKKGGAVKGKKWEGRRDEGRGGVGTVLTTANSGRKKYSSAQSHGVKQGGSWRKEKKAFYCDS